MISVMKNYNCMQKDLLDKVGVSLKLLSGHFVGNLSLRLCAVDHYQSYFYFHLHQLSLHQTSEPAPSHLHPAVTDKITVNENKMETHF